MASQNTSLPGAFACPDEPIVAFGKNQYEVLIDNGEHVVRVDGPRLLLALVGKFSEGVELDSSANEFDRMIAGKLISDAVDLAQIMWGTMGLTYGSATGDIDHAEPIITRLRQILAYARVRDSIRYDRR